MSIANLVAFEWTVEKSEEEACALQTIVPDRMDAAEFLHYLSIYFHDFRDREMAAQGSKRIDGRLPDDEVQDQETASYAYELLERLASLAGKNTAPSDNNAREAVAPSTAKTKPIKSHAPSAPEGSPVPAVITKIDRVKTRQGDSLFLKVDVGGETVRVFGRPEELAERLEASGYDIPASEIEAGMELHLPCLVKVGQGHNGYKPGSPASPVLTCWGGRTSKSSCPKLPNDRLAPYPPSRVRETKASLTRIP